MSTVRCEHRGTETQSCSSDPILLGVFAVRPAVLGSDLMLPFDEEHESNGTPHCLCAGFVPSVRNEAVQFGQCGLRDSDCNLF